MEHRIQRNWQRALRFFSERSLDAAKASCDSIIAVESGHAQAHWMLSCLALHEGKFRAAAESAILAGRNLRHEPIHVALNITWALISVGESEFAVGLLRDKIAQLRDQSPALLDAARQCSLLDRHDDAMSFIESALKAGIDNALVHSLRGSILQHTGALARAEESYERAIERQSDFAQAHWLLAQLSLTHGAERRIDRLRRLRAGAISGSDERAHFCYALFRELDKIGDTTSAWLALQEGFECRHRQVPYDAREEALLVDAIIANSPPTSLFQSVPVSGDTPIFIVGMPRTGTTLLERILGNHPDVAVCGELNDFRMQFKWTSDHHCPGYIDRIGAARISEIDPELLGQRYLNKTAWLRIGKTFFSDKNQTNFLFCGPIHKALPQARIIHLRRNAMDSCFSNLKELFAPPNYPYSYGFDDLAEHYRNYSRLMAHWRTAMPGAILDVDYEDLVREPEQQAQRIMAFCGLKQAGPMANIADNTQPVSTASNVQVREPIHQRNIGSWRRYAAQLAPLERVLGSRDLLG